MCKNLIFLLIVISMITTCGGGQVDINDKAFEPKIVIQGTLFPHQKVNKIKITRNFPLNVNITENDILIKNAQAFLIDEAGAAYQLTYSPTTDYYRYTGDDLVIEYGASYTLEVTATIEGQELHAKSTTTVPQSGFEILESKSILGSMAYRERDENNALEHFKIIFNRSPETDFYALSLNALDADVTTFIYNNPFGKIDEEDVLKDFDHFKYLFTWIQDTPKEIGESSMEIFWFFTWFYGKYQVIIYAADKNLKDFLQTHNSVKSIDGNFHEPAFHFEGDGIGVFGSAIADTVYFTIIQD